MASAVVLETPAAAAAEEISRSRDLQQGWAQTPIHQRLAVLRRARHLLADSPDRLAQAISPELTRTPADTIVAEVLPLLAACRFLEQQAAALLRPRRLGRKRLPFWLAGVDVTVERVPFGPVLVIAPANYPLLLAGVQVLQALAAGNAAVWKPGRGGRAVAELVASALYAAGLPAGLLQVTDESIEAAVAAIEARPALIVFTGSAHAGRAVQRMAAERAIPVIAELSGCDAVYVLPGADPARVTDALAFGMRLNGSATCMAPRRLVLIGSGHEALLRCLRECFASSTDVPVAHSTRALLDELLDDALSFGASIPERPIGTSMTPLLIEDGSPRMRLTQTDLFAPVLTVLRARDSVDAVAIDRACPFGLTASVFGPEPAARDLGRRLEVGSVLINDLIVPTADPRVSFGGRRASGFGVTRGAEGLLAMTAVRTTSVRRSASRRHLQPTTPTHEEFFEGIVQMSHAATAGKRLAGFKRLVRAAGKLR